jgi:hypothetical protein
MPAISFGVASSLTVSQTLTVSSLTSALVRADSNGVFSVTNLQSNFSLSGNTLSLASSLTSINSVTSGAGQNLVLATGTGGTGLTIASSTLLATFAGVLSASNTEDASTVDGATGSLRTLGGLNVAQSAWFGGRISAGGGTSSASGGQITITKYRDTTFSQAALLVNNINNSITTSATKAIYGVLVDTTYISGASNPLSLAGFHYTGALNSSSGSFPANHYGLFLGNIASGSNNYAIYTGTGTVRFGDATDATTADGTTGAVRSLGGLSVAKSLFAGEGIYAHAASIVGFDLHSGGQYLYRIGYTTDSTKLRWTILPSGSEFGSNIGSNFEVANYNDTGVALNTGFSIVRATGDISFKSTSDATSADGTTGALRTLGGFSVAKNAFFGDSVTVANGVHVSNISTFYDSFYVIDSKEPGRGSLVLYSSRSPVGDGKNIWIGGGGQYGTTSNGSWHCSRNTALGWDALLNNTIGDTNVAIGNESMTALLTGRWNTAVGGKSLFSNVYGIRNLALGGHALSDNITGSFNTAVGMYALTKCSYGSLNVALGYHAGHYEQGHSAFYVDNQDRTDTDGDKAGALLYGTFSANPAEQRLTINAATTISNTDDATTADGTTGAVRSLGGLSVVKSGYFGSDCFVNGVRFGKGPASNSESTAVGYRVLNSQISGSATAFGYEALYSSTTGFINSAFGYRCQYSLVDGWGNTAFGQNALNDNISGDKNVALGRFAGAHELGDNAFYVDNQDRSDTAGDKAGALLYGTFNATAASQTLVINAATTVGGSIATPAGGSTTARLLFGATAGFGIYYGSGAPTVSAAQGSIYIRSDGSSTSTRLYVNTNGSTTWTNFTSAA